MNKKNIEKEAEKLYNKYFKGKYFNKPKILAVLKEAIRIK